MSVCNFYRVSLAVPYWNGATYRAILRSFFLARAIDGPDRAELRSLLGGLLRVHDVLLCGSGSLALELALRACDVRRGDEVIVPAFCCTSVVPPLLAIGAQPVLADSGEDLNITAETAQAVLTRKTKAIVVPHLFGNPAHIESIVKLARPEGIRVIDDAAQALGATIDGQPVGSFGDAGILSFGSDKVCSGLGGGALVSRQQEIFNRGCQIELPSPRSLAILRAVVETLLWRRWRRWTAPLQAALCRVKDPEAPPEPYRREAMANLNAGVASTLVRTLRENIAARRARVDAYQELLGRVEGLTLVPHGSGSACLTQVLRVWPKSDRDDSASDLIAALHRAGYEVQGSYIPIHLLSPYQDLPRRCLLRAEKVWPDLVELPCEPDMPLQHVERIASIVRQVIDRSKGE